MLEDSLCAAAGTSQAAAYETNAFAEERSPVIGLFDSGVGGLSVLQELLKRFPAFDYLYLGDTARVPYGTRSVKTITRYSLQAAQFLVDRQVDVIVMACNTASSVALRATQQAYPAHLTVGMVEAGAQAAVEAAARGKIAVIGTECTVTTKAYERRILRSTPTAEVHSTPCPFLVSLAEEGWTEGYVAEKALRRYLEPLFQRFQGSRPDCLVLGCTHFTRFRSVIERMVPPGVSLINPAERLGQLLEEYMPSRRREKRAAGGDVKYYVTDACARFARVGELFLGRSIKTESLLPVSLDSI